eukprot:CAMPEP_0119024668 /NCGR_PEP_ID=MMETSP1176-20130426/32292_1 /TAXON_ID=265551 /ORGANISM="Synedropsis recta cf, Strain CCMP1620" /LENGTH=360 /DNA_ID=CAMNT_0006980027 /DNA_START=116 /DNA_END=1198 /DNA_ORIENTATION=-
MSINTKEAVRLYATYTHEVSPHVDWDKLHDEYVVAYIQDKRVNKRRLHRQRHHDAISGAVDAAQRAGPSIITNTDADNRDSSSSEDDPPKRASSVLDQALDDMKEIMAKAAAAQRSKAERQTVDDDLLGVDDDIVTDAPSESPTGLSDDTVAPSAAPSKSTDPAPTPKRPDDDRVTPPDDDEFIGMPIPVYRYNPGTNCGAPSGSGVPCAPDNLRELCNKEAGKFSDCLEACIPSFCCIHDAPPATNTIAPNCNEDPNCAEYAYCYIVWWKFHDTIGPATKLQVEQTDDFFDIDADFIEGDVTGSAFYQELLLHHFDDSQEIIDAGTVAINSTLDIFDSDLIFLNPEFWDAESVIPDPPP